MAGAFPQAEFGALRSQSRLAKIADAKRTDYWGGVTWAASATITNDGANAGTHTYSVTPGEDNEFEVMGGTLINGDAATRNGFVRVVDPTETFGLHNIVSNRVQEGYGIQAARGVAFPGFNSQASTQHSNATRIIVSGTLVLQAFIQSIAVSQDSEFNLICRVRGDKPSFSMDSPTGSAQVINLEGFF